MLYYSKQGERRVECINLSQLRKCTHVAHAESKIVTTCAGGGRSHGEFGDCKD